MGLVMIFCLMKDDPLLYQSLDIILLWVWVFIEDIQTKFTEVFDPAMSTGYRVNKLIARQSFCLIFSTEVTNDVSL